jgi:hypothetical protein
VQSTTKYRDLDALAAAVERLGGEFQRDQTQYAWWGSRAGGGNYGHRPVEDDGKCLHAIKIKGTNPKNGYTGPWEIGVLAAPDGDGFQLEYDYYGGAGQALLAAFGGKGTELTKLAEEYGAEVAMRQLARAGFRTTRSDNLQTVR